MTDSKGEKTESPTIGLSLNMQFAAGRTVVFQTYMPQDINVEGLNVILDKLNSVGDRAEAYYAQEQARKQLEVDENVLAGIVKRLGEVEGNIRLKALADNRRNPKPSPQDEIAKKQAYDSLEEAKRRVAVDKAHLADLIVKAGNRDGASSPANS